MRPKLSTSQSAVRQAAHMPRGTPAIEPSVFKGIFQIPIPWRIGRRDRDTIEEVCQVRLEAYSIRRWCSTVIADERRESGATVRIPAPGQVADTFSIQPGHGGVKEG